MEVAATAAQTPNCSLAMCSLDCCDGQRQRDVGAAVHGGGEHRRCPAAAAVADFDEPPSRSPGRASTRLFKARQEEEHRLALSSRRHAA